MTKKYFKSLKEARKALKERNKGHADGWLGIYKMPKGTRRHGEYAVCSYMEFINTY